MNVGELTIGLRADVARLQADMNAAKGSVQGAMKDIEQYVGYAKTAFLTLGGVLTIGAFKSAIDGAIEFKAKLLDLSIQTGIGVSALGALGKVGKLTQTSLEDIAGASNKLSKAIETQNADSKGAAQAIAALGLNFAQFKQLKPEEQLLAVSKAMADFQDGSGKAAAAMLLFGKTGAAMLPFLTDLADKNELVSKQTFESALQAKAYEKNIATLNALGNDWKRTLAEALLPALIDTTGELIKLRKEGDSFNLVGESMKVTLQTLTVLGRNVAFVFSQIGDGIGALAAAELQGAQGNFRAAFEIMRDYQARGEEARKALDQADARTLGVGGGSNAGAGRGSVNPAFVVPNRPRITGLEADEKAPKVAKEKDLYADLVKTVNQRLAQQELEADRGRKLTELESLQAKAYADIDGGIIKATLSQKLFIDGLFEEAKAQDSLANEREQSRKENDKTLDDADRRLRSLRDESAAMQQQLDEYGLTTEELQALTVARDRATAASLRGRAAVLDGIGAEGQLRDLYIAQADALDQVAQKKEQLAAREARDRNDPNAGAARAVKEYLSDIKRAGDATYNAVQNSLRSLEDGLVGILRGGNAKDIAKQWVNGIISEITRLYVVKPLLASIFGGSGGGGGGLFSSLLSLAGSYFGGGSANASGSGGYATAAGINGGRANGGPVEAGKSYLVGERGPEIVRMGGAGTVVPNTGGKPVTINIANNGQPVNARETGRSESEQGTIINLVLDAVASNIASGGKVAQAGQQTWGVNRAGAAPRY